jgi:hypothetical protein
VFIIIISTGGFRSENHGLTAYIKNVYFWLWSKSKIFLCENKRLLCAFFGEVFDFPGGYSINARYLEGKNQEILLFGQSFPALLCVADKLCGFSLRV